jgi:hypothetical protein
LLKDILAKNMKTSNHGNNNRLCLLLSACKNGQKFTFGVTDYLELHCFFGICQRNPLERVICRSSHYCGMEKHDFKLANDWTNSKLQVG